METGALDHATVGLHEPDQQPLFSIFGVALNNGSKGLHHLGNGWVEFG